MALTATTNASFTSRATVALPGGNVNNTTLSSADHENSTYYYPDASDHWTAELLFYHYLWTYAAPCLFGVITVTGTFGNALVVYVIMSRKYLNTATNLLLLNLAFADVSFLVICGTFAAYKYAAATWGLGDSFCKFVQYCNYVAAYVTVYTLVAVAGLRFLTVVWSTRSMKYRTKKNVLLVCALIWITTLLSNIPTFVVHRVKGTPGYSYCGIRAESIGSLFITFFVFSYALPLMLVTVFYLQILLHLRRARQASLVQNRGRSRTSKAARAFRVIVIVIVMFAVSWLPLHVQALVSYFGSLPAGPTYEVFRILWSGLAYSNSCINPLIYNWFSQDFRKAFREVMFCGFLKSPLRHRTSDRLNDTETMTIVGQSLATVKAEITEDLCPRISTNCVNL